MLSFCETYANCSVCVESHKNEMDGKNGVSDASQAGTAEGERGQSICTHDISKSLRSATLITSPASWPDVAKGILCDILLQKDPDPKTPRTYDRCLLPPRCHPHSFCILYCQLLIPRVVLSHSSLVLRALSMIMGISTTLLRVFYALSVT
jgi:hypothetical protein